ncbi:MAG: hypothetical protein ACTHLE_07500 [Agriterribacter sp.]
MQVRRIIFIILACVAIALFCIYTIPVQRSYQAEIEINADNLITYRTLHDTANWNTWYKSDTKISQPAKQTVSIIQEKPKQRFDYLLQESETISRQGEIQIIKSNKWNTKIKWIETLAFEKDIRKKVKLLFHPEEFKGGFLKNVIAFKNHIEHPNNIYGGLTFEQREISANKMVTLSDTIAIAGIEDKIAELHQTILNTVPQEKILQKNTFMSQHEMLDDSTAQVKVAIMVADDLNTIQAPLDIRDNDDHRAIVIHVQKGYNEISEDVSVMYQWLKKNDARPSTGYWIEHDASVPVIAKNTAAQPLTIIQEFYSLK